MLSIKILMDEIQPLSFKKIELKSRNKFELLALLELLAYHDYSLWSKDELFVALLTTTIKIFKQNSKEIIKLLVFENMTFTAKTNVN